MAEYIVVAVMVVLALAYVVRNLLQLARGKPPDCGCSRCSVLQPPNEPDQSSAESPRLTRLTTVPPDRPPGCDQCSSPKVD